MDFPPRGKQAEEENPGVMTPFAAELFAKQPFRGYTLKAALASTDREAAFRAQDLTMERPVVLKTLKPCREREGVVEDFFSLAGSVARLRCPGVARGLDAGRGDGNFFLVHAFVRGETPAARLARLQAGRIAEKDSLRIVAGVASALQSLFQHGHPHGHLTPGNCVQGENGSVTLTDIGFAWTAAWKTDREAFLAKPGYLPPERIEGEINVDIRGDLYSLGCLWFRLLAGRDVFQGGTPEETLEMHLKKKPEPLHKLDDRITETTSAMVRWLLEKDRDARPRTPKELLRRLVDSHPLLPGTPDAGGEGGDASPPEAAPEAEAPGALEEVDRLIRETAL